jgi:hypothetical protein
MGSARTFGLGIVGAAVTMLARNATRRAMHDSSGRPRLPQAARRPNSMTALLLVAAASGALLALTDVLHQHRRELSDAR